MYSEKNFDWRSKKKFLDVLKQCNLTTLDFKKTQQITVLQEENCNKFDGSHAVVIIQ